jgi:hypothetical protein
MHHSHGRDESCPAKGTDGSSGAGDDEDHPPAAGAGIPAPREYMAENVTIRRAIARHPSPGSCADFPAVGDVPDLRPVRLQERTERHTGIVFRPVGRGRA